MAEGPKPYEWFRRSLERGGKSRMSFGETFSGVLTRFTAGRLAAYAG